MDTPKAKDRKLLRSFFLCILTQKYDIMYATRQKGEIKWNLLKNLLQSWHVTWG